MRGLTILSVLFAVAAVAICGSARAAGPTYLPAIGCTGYVYGNGINTPINCLPASPTPTLPFDSVKNHGASGSTQQTTGSITSGQSTLTVASVIDFAVGQGVRIMGSGPANIAAPIGVTGVTVQGTSGTTTYSYEICSLGYQGSYSTCVAASSASGPNGITYNGSTYYGSTQNYVQVGVTMGSNSSGYVVYRGINGASPTLWTIGFGATFKDQGIGWTAGGSWVGPNYLPTSYPTAVGADWWVAVITAINGNVLTLGATTQAGASAIASTTVTNAIVYHDDANAFNVAATANASAGANIQVPCGSYNLSYAVTMNYNYIGFTGQGMCSIINTFGTGNDFALANSNVAAQQRGNFVSGMYIVDRNKSNGYTIYGTNLFNFQFSNIQNDFPPYGFYFLNSNTIIPTNVDVNSGTRGSASSGFIMTSDSTNYTCCLNAYNFYIHGNGQYIGGPSSIGNQDKNGFEFDGNVATVYAFGMADSDIEGNGFLILNDTGNNASPDYLTFYSASCEFPTGRCVNLFGPGSVAGPGDVYFTDSTVTGAQNNNANFVTDDTSARITFRGGKSANAGCRGFDIASAQTSIIGAEIGNNSTPSAGGTTGTCDGVVLESAARGTVVESNQIGDPFNPTVQNYPVTIVNGQDYFNVTGNTFLGNVTNCVNNGSTAAPSRIVTNNAGSC